MRERQFNGPVSPRILALPRDRRGFPVPYFVHWQDGEPVFPAMDPKKLYDCVRFGNCWVCGQRLGAHKAFVIGPMCVCNRISAEPPSHLDCALFSAMNCPFLTQPRMRRMTTQDGTYLDQPVVKPAGIMIERNPGVCCVWTTKKFHVKRDHTGVLFDIGEPETVSFWAQGRRATRDEVDESIRTGLPILAEVAAQDEQNGHAGAMREFDRAVSRMFSLLEQLHWPASAIEAVSGQTVTGKVTAA